MAGPPSLTDCWNEAEGEGGPEAELRGPLDQALLLTCWDRGGAGLGPKVVLEVGRVLRCVSAWPGRNV